MDQSSFLAFDFANIDVADDIAVLVERYRAARRVDLGRPQCFHERRLVLDLAVYRCESGLEHRPLDVGRGGVEAWVVLPFGAESGREFLVDRIVELGRIPAGGDDTERLVAHILQYRLVECGHAAYDGNLAFQSVLIELFEPTEAVRAGEAKKDGVDIG